MNFQNKVIAYITHNGNLLVFRHTHHPEAGIQVPAGTVEPGESLNQAVLREAQEETGLEFIQIKKYLGTDVYPVALQGEPTILHRHFFHLVLDREPPVQWVHLERHRSDGNALPIEFSFYWVRLSDDLQELAGDQNAFLKKIYQVES